MAVNKKTLKKSRAKTLIYFRHRVELLVMICCAIFIKILHSNFCICGLFDPKNPRKTEGPCTHSKGKANNLRDSKDCNERKL